MILEKINILTVYKQDGNLGIEIHEEMFNDYEIYGFLKVYLEGMKERFLDELFYNDD